MINQSTSVCYFGIIIDQDFTISSHVGKRVSSCFYLLRRIRLIQHSLTTDAIKTLVNSLVMSQVDFCNLVMAGQPACCLNRVQSVLDPAARVITEKWKYDHITLHLWKLHWLPVPHCVDYKLCLTVYKALIGPSTIVPFLPLYPIASFQSRRTLCSATTRNLVIA